MVNSTQNNRNSDTIEPSYSNEDFNIGKSNHRIYKLTYGKSGLVKFIEKLLNLFENGQIYLKMVEF